MIGRGRSHAQTINRGARVLSVQWVQRNVFPFWRRDTLSPRSVFTIARGPAGYNYVHVRCKSASPKAFHRLLIGPLFACMQQMSFLCTHQSRIADSAVRMELMHAWSVETRGPLANGSLSAGRLLPSSTTRPPTHHGRPRHAKRPFGNATLAGHGLYVSRDAENPSPSKPWRRYERCSRRP